MNSSFFREFRRPVAGDVRKRNLFPLLSAKPYPSRLAQVWLILKKSRNEFRHFWSFMPRSTQRLPDTALLGESFGTGMTRLPITLSKVCLIRSWPASIGLHCQMRRYWSTNSKRHRKRSRVEATNWISIQTLISLAA